MSEMGTVERTLRKATGLPEDVTNILFEALRAEWNAVPKCDHWFDSGPFMPKPEDMCVRDGCYALYREVYP